MLDDNDGEKEEDFSKEMFDENISGSPSNVERLPNSFSNNGNGN